MIPKAQAWKTFDARYAVKRGREIANEESRRTRQLTQGGGHNDVFDAERHARWTYRMSQELGYKWADWISGAHELQDEVEYQQPSNEFAMDSHNNVVGINAAINGQPIPDRNNKDLIYMRSDDLEYYAH